MLENLEQLSFDNDPGVYEVKAKSGITYEITIPESFVDVASIIISLNEGVEENLEGREVLEAFAIFIKVGEKAIFTVEDKVKDRIQDLKTFPILSIIKLS